MPVENSRHVVEHFSISTAMELSSHVCRPATAQQWIRSTATAGKAVCGLADSSRQILRIPRYWLRPARGRSMTKPTQGFPPCRKNIAGWPLIRLWRGDAGPARVDTACDLSSWGQTSSVARRPSAEALFVPVVEGWPSGLRQRASWCVIRATVSKVRILSPSATRSRGLSSLSFRHPPH